MSESEVDSLGPDLQEHLDGLDVIRRLDIVVISGSSEFKQTCKEIRNAERALQDAPGPESYAASCAVTALRLKLIRVVLDQAKIRGVTL